MVQKLALVTGATGLLGRQLVVTLLADGLAVRALARAASDTSRLPPQVEVYRSAIDDRQAIGWACQDADYLFHLAGYLTVGAPFGAGRPDAQYQAVNVDFTRRLLEAALEHNVGRFIYASSSSVYALAAPVPTPEEGPLNPTSPYGRSKLQAETWVAAFQEQGLATTVIRPPVVYGPGDRYFTPTALNLARLPLLPLVSGGRNIFDMVYVQDVAELMWLAAGSPAAAGRTYNAGPGRPRSISDLVAAYKRLTGRGPRIVEARPWAMRLSAGLVRPLLGRLAPGAEAALTPAGLALMQHHLHLDMSRAKRELGFWPRFDLDDGLALTLASLAEDS
jgi:2-alkyl-3-oxoalkanoate reductase